MFRASSIAFVLIAATFLAGGATWFALPTEARGSDRLPPVSRSADKLSSVRVVYPGYGHEEWMGRTVGGKKTASQIATQASAPEARISSVQEPRLVPVAQARFDLNSATAEQLNEAGGGQIGKAVLKGRPYRSVEELLSKRIVTRATFTIIKHRVSVGT